MNCQWVRLLGLFTVLGTLAAGSTFGDDDPKNKDNKGTTGVKPKPEYKEGKAELAKLNDVIRDQVRSQLKGSKALDPVKDLIRTDVVAKDPKVTYADKKFSWSVPAKKTLAEADTKKIEEALRKVLKATIEEEIDPAKRLKKDDLEQAAKAADTTTIEITKYTKLDDLNTKTLREYVRKYAAANKDSYEPIKTWVVLDSLLNQLFYDATRQPRITWEYPLIAGKELTAPEKATIENFLATYLDKSFEAVATEEKYTDEDKAAFKGYVAIGTVKIEPLQTGLALTDVTTTIVRKNLSRVFESNGRVLKDLDNVGVSVMDEVDRLYLIEHLDFTKNMNEDDPAKIVSFEWKYRPKAETAADDVVKKVLSDVLTFALRTGGGVDSQRIGNDFGVYFEAGIKSLSVTKIKAMRANDLGQQELRTLVQLYVPANQPDLDAFKNKIDIDRIREAQGLTVVSDKDSKKIKWILLTDPVREGTMGKEADLKEADKDEVKKAIKILLGKAIDYAKFSKPALAVIEEDRPKVQKWIDTVEIEIEAVAKSKDTKKLDDIARERAIDQDFQRLVNQRTQQRLSDLEDRLQGLETMIKTNGLDQVQLRFIETRGGFCSRPSVTPTFVIKTK